VAVDEQMSAWGRLNHQVTPNRLQLVNMVPLRCHHAGTSPVTSWNRSSSRLVLPERVRHGPARIKDGQDVASADVAVRRDSHRAAISQYLNLYGLQWVVLRRSAFGPCRPDTSHSAQGGTLPNRFRRLPA
jgi:hypothetical protein